MPITRILTYSEQQEIKPISKNNQSKYAQIELEAEETDLKNMIGIELLQDLQKNPSSTYNTLLLSGTTYTDESGNEITIQGLKWMFAFMVYARYLECIDFADTYTGTVIKTHAEASAVQQGQKKLLIDRNKEIAMTEWANIKNYLNNEYINFPLWNYCKTKKVFTPKVSTLRKTFN